MNQSLLAKEPQCDPVELFTDIAMELGNYDQIHLSLPLLGETPEAVFNSHTALAGIQELHNSMAMKVPVSWRYLPVIKRLADAGHCVNATCVFSVYQADLAARAGATIISAFVGRMNDINPNYGYQVLTAIKKRMGEHLIVLAGSVRSEEMVARVEECGADVATVPKKVLEAMATDPHSVTSAQRFNADFNAWVGEAA